MLTNCPKCLSEKQILISHDEAKHEESCRCEECGFEYICPDPLSAAMEDIGHEKGFEPYANYALK